jgi:predicted nuclease of predicted toxin-antitoxin system
VKLLIDENLSPRLAGQLQDLYPGTRHVEECGLISADDSEIWSYALAQGFAIVTKDSDFFERGVIEENAPKVIWLRIGNCTTVRAGFVLRNHFERINTFLVGFEEKCLELALSAPNRKAAK